MKAVVVAGACLPALLVGAAACNPLAPKRYMARALVLAERTSIAGEEAVFIAREMTAIRAAGAAVLASEPTDHAPECTVRHVEGTRLFQVSVKSGDAGYSAAICNRIVDDYVEGCAPGADRKLIDRAEAANSPCN